MICDACKKEKEEATATPNRFSFKGWEFKTWVKMNKESLRLMLSVGVGLFSAWVVGFENFATSASIGTLATAVSKLILDSFDYWVSK
jgi:hypothetical protein